MIINVDNQSVDLHTRSKGVGAGGSFSYIFSEILYPTLGICKNTALQELILDFILNKGLLMLHITIYVLSSIKS